MFPPFQEMPEYVYEWYFCSIYFEAQINLPDPKKGTWKRSYTVSST